MQTVRLKLQMRINEWWWNCSSVNICESNVTRAWVLEKNLSPDKIWTHELSEMTWLFMSSRSSADRAPVRCTGGHRFQSYLDSDFFWIPRSCYTIIRDKWLNTKTLRVRSNELNHNEFVTKALLTRGKFFALNLYRNFAEKKWILQESASIELYLP